MRIFLTIYMPKTLIAPFPAFFFSQKKKNVEVVGLIKKRLGDFSVFISNRKSLLL